MNSCDITFYQYAVEEHPHAVFYHTCSLLHCTFISNKSNPSQAVPTNPVYVCFFPNIAAMVIVF